MGWGVVRWPIMHTIHFLVVTALTHVCPFYSLPLLF